MEIGNILIGAVLTLLCTLPFILISRNRKNTDHQILLALTNLAQQQNCKISRHEICGNYSIGIDESKNILFFIKQIKGKFIEEFINLDQIQTCKVKKVNGSMVGKDGHSNTFIEKLDLSFITNTNAELILPFYDSDEYLQVYGELQSINTWSTIINSRLLVKK